MSTVRTFFILSLLCVSGCVPFWRQWMPSPAEPSAAVAAAQMPAHESWCYRTLGAVECYTKPQDLPPESLVSVDPPSRRPVSREGYAKALADSLEAGK